MTEQNIYIAQAVQKITNEHTICEHHQTCQIQHSKSLFLFFFKYQHANHTPLPVKACIVS